MFTASETAATLRSQQAFTSHMSKSRFKVIWPAPMEDQFFGSDGEQSLRGKAFSFFPCRGAIDILDPQFATGRILHTVITFGHICHTKPATR